MNNNLKFSEALNQINKELNLPHLVLDNSGRCLIRYADFFNVEIILNFSEEIQLHSYIVSTKQCLDLPNLAMHLLKWNNSECEFGGSFIGINDQSGFITFNTHILLPSIDAIIVVNILNNFIEASIKTKEKIENILTNNYSMAKAETKFLPNQFTMV